MLIENEVYNNRSKGVLIGSTNKKVVVRDNVEYGNLGLLPQLTSNIKAKAATVSNKFLRRARKNKAHIKKAMEESEPESFLDAMLKDGYAKHAVYEKVMENLERNYAMCALCKVPPSDKKQFAKCSRFRGRPHTVLQSARNPSGSSIKKYAKIKLLSIQHFWITTSQSESIVCSF